MAGLFDPPKDGVADAITEIREAGIKVVVITGDHSKTAAVSQIPFSLVRVFHVL